MSSRSLSFGPDSRSLEGIIVVIDDALESRSRGEKSFTGSMEDFLDGTDFLNQSSVFRESSLDSSEIPLLSFQSSAVELEASDGNVQTDQDESAIDRSARKRFSRRQDHRQRQKLIDQSLEGNGRSTSQTVSGKTIPNSSIPDQNRIERVSKLSNEVKRRAERNQALSPQPSCREFNNSSAPELYKREPYPMTGGLNKSRHQANSGIRSRETHLSRTRSTPSLFINRPRSHITPGPSRDEERLRERRASLSSTTDLQDSTLTGIGRKPDDMSPHHSLSNGAQSEFSHLVWNKRKATPFENALPVNVGKEADPPLQGEATILPVPLVQAVTPQLRRLKDELEVSHSDLAIDRITLFDSFRDLLYQVGMNTDFAAEAEQKGD